MSLRIPRRMEGSDASSWVHISDDGSEDYESGPAPIVPIYESTSPRRNYYTRVGFRSGIGIPLINCEPKRIPMCCRNTEVLFALDPHPKRILCSYVCEGTSAVYSYSIKRSSLPHVCSLAELIYRLREGAEAWLQERYLELRTSKRIALPAFKDVLSSFTIIHIGFISPEFIKCKLQPSASPAIDASVFFQSPEYVARPISRTRSRTISQESSNLRRAGTVPSRNAAATSQPRLFRSNSLQVSSSRIADLSGPSAAPPTFERRPSLGPSRPLPGLGQRHEKFNVSKPTVDKVLPPQPHQDPHAGTSTRPEMPHEEQREKREEHHSLRRVDRRVTRPIRSYTSPSISQTLEQPQSVAPTSHKYYVQHNNPAIKPDYGNANASKRGRNTGYALP